MGIGVGSGGSSYPKKGSPGIIHSGSPSMGRILGSPCRDDYKSSVVSYEDYEHAKPEDIETGNRFIRLQSHVIQTQQVGLMTIVQARYPECPNFEGMKIIVFYTRDFEKLDLSKIEPHFLHDSNVVARFTPTKRGWEYARNFCLTVNY